MKAALRHLVQQRAEDRCEYCRLQQTHAPYSAFHVDHITPKKHGGSDDPSTLAFACNRCNRYKGANLTGIDPASGDIVPLFHPRKDSWDVHFEFRGAAIVGLTSEGRVTVRVLNMNDRERLQLRERLIALGQLDGILDSVAWILSRLQDWLPPRLSRRSPTVSFKVHLEPLVGCGRPGGDG